MAHPKSKVSKQRRNKRRSHDRLTPPTLCTCSKCNAIIVRHHMCPECGYYRGQQLIAMKGDDDA